jgi:hypothetical protein
LGNVQVTCKASLPSNIGGMVSVFPLLQSGAGAEFAEGNKYRSSSKMSSDVSSIYYI